MSDTRNRREPMVSDIRISKYESGEKRNSSCSKMDVSLSQRSFVSVSGANSSTDQRTEINYSTERNKEFYKKINSSIKG